MASDGRKQPPWIPPKAEPDAQFPQLKIYNSLTRSKNDFVPVDPAGKMVTWYACGPTVYEDAHLGHAKNYISTDIIRRIMKDYFGFQVKFVMNTTDLDDKIILRSRQQYLLAQFKRKYTTKGDSVSGALLAEVPAALFHYTGKNLPLLPSNISPVSLLRAARGVYEKKTEPISKDGAATEKQSQAATATDLLIGVHIQTVRSAVEALLSPGKLPDFFAKTDDIFLPYLDDLHGAEMDPNNHEISLGLSQKYERRFFEDMEALNVLSPDILTRVTEYVPQIIRFVEKIVANGFGYATSDGSVYFDIDSFEKTGHSYSRLEPWNKNDLTLQADGEGSLSKEKSEKRSQSHFALWKASKSGEPAWSSPWGHGRPGWHIECSAMASEAIGKTMDIHSGGIDLRFPHHDNELAQSEAYWSTPGCQVQWANYFVHMGQLRIRGLKMSKSLKNYTTIRTVLSEKEWTARSLRICFLLRPWQDGIEVTDELMKAVTSWEGKLNNFFLKSIDLVKHPSPTSISTQEPGVADHQLLSALQKAKDDVHAALCNSFDTSTVMRIISDLVTESNSAEAPLNGTVILLARWITHIVIIFGLDPQGDLKNEECVGWSGLDITWPADPYVYKSSQLRDKVRFMARSKSIDHEALVEFAHETVVPAPDPSDDLATSFQNVLQVFCAHVESLATMQAPAKDLLALCDQLRDEHLWKLGIYLEDRNDPQPALVRPLDRLLVEARAEREAAANAKIKAKQEQEAKEAEMKKQLLERSKVAPSLMFRDRNCYSEWDEDGIPTYDAHGNVVSRNLRKWLIKEWEKQKLRHEEWLATQHAAQE